MFSESVLAKNIEEKSCLTCEFLINHRRILRKAMTSNLIVPDRRLFPHEILLIDFHQFLSLRSLDR